MKRIRPFQLAIFILAIAGLVMLAHTDLPIVGSAPAEAANVSVGYRHEVELGVQALTPTAGQWVELTIPTRTRHAEFFVVSGPVYVRWNDSIPNATTAFPWPAGHMRKEANDDGKLSGFRAIGDGEIRVIYFGDRREQ